MSEHQKRRLRVKRDRLRILSAGDAARVHGGKPPWYNTAPPPDHTHSPGASNYCV